MAGKPENWMGSDGKARSEVVNYLAQRGGEVHDESGNLLGEGSEMRRALGRSRSLSNLVRTMAHDGMLEREVYGRRTYRIKLIDDWGYTRSSLDGDVATVTPLRPGMTGANLDGHGGVDYGLLAESLLAIVVKRASEPAPAKADKITVDRLRKAEQALTSLEEQLTDVAAERTNLQARVAELEEQARIYEHNMTVLKAEMDKPRRGAQTFEEAIGKKGRDVLAEIMKALPETPTSKPRRATRGN